MSFFLPRSNQNPDNQFFQTPMEELFLTAMSIMINYRVRLVEKAINTDQGFSSKKSAFQQNES